MSTKGRTKPLFTLGWLALGTIFLTAWAHPAPSERPEELSRLILAPPTLDECDAECVEDAEECRFNGWKAHTYSDIGAGEGWMTGDLNHGCVYSYPETCEGHGHEDCDPEEEEEENLDRLDLAVRTLTGSDLQLLFDRNQESLLWNPDRDAVQVWGCGEKVTSSFQLTAEQVASLN